MTPDSVLAEIDATLESWESGKDAARWHPDAARPDEPRDPEVAPVIHCPLDYGGSVCVCGSGEPAGQLLAG